MFGRDGDKKKEQISLTDALNALEEDEALSHIQFNDRKAQLKRSAWKMIENGSQDPKLNISRKDMLTLYISFSTQWKENKEYNSKIGD